MQTNYIKSEQEHYEVTIHSTNEADSKPEIVLIRVRMKIILSSATNEEFIVSDPQIQKNKVAIISIAIIIHITWNPQEEVQPNIEHNQLNICTPFKNNIINHLQQSQQNNPLKNGRYYQAKGLWFNITTNLFDKFNNRDYKSLRNLNQEDLNYNRVMMDHHMRMREI
jgi:hypothetical protein